MRMQSERVASLTLVILMHTQHAHSRSARATQRVQKGSHGLGQHSRQNAEGRDTKALCSTRGRRRRLARGCDATRRDATRCNAIANVAAGAAVEEERRSVGAAGAGNYATAEQSTGGTNNEEGIASD